MLPDKTRYNDAILKNVQIFDIPPTFQTLLNSQEVLPAAAQSALALYAQWLPQSKLPFFPEYTDHGPVHISSVLNSVDQLLSNESRPLLNSADAGALTISVLLHDIGMHMTEDGFRRLVKGETTLVPIQELGDRPWPNLWEEFRTEMVRLSSVENVRLFGSSEPIQPPALDHKDWTKSQYLLVGEFIRRHHPRLAHQIALHGFPGTQDERFVLDTLDASTRNLVGLIARSHGMPLRPCIDYLQQDFFTRIDPLKVHAVFLMVLLRIADYLQVDANRSTMHLRLQSLRSPISTREHRKHLAVTQVTRDQDDYEAVKAIVRPENVVNIDIYLGLADLFRDIQAELDNSWAVLGEVYGRQTEQKLNLLGINVRRFRSTLNDAAFLNKLPFVPIHLRFQSADSRLFKLLIKPLYGTDPNIGLREIVQNSVDAVRELEKYCERHNVNRSMLDLPKQPADIIVQIDKDAHGNEYLVVKDVGIGMTLDVVRDYFLRVGASFRESSKWRREFTDEKRHSTVLRTGYFGIGALAAFLIGPKIRVSTRYVTDNQGIEFTAGIESDPIQISRVKRPIGTTISIPLSPEMRSWGPHVYFFLKKPSLLVCGRSQDTFYPDMEDDLPATWQRVPDVADPVVLWSRPKEFTNRVTHNGFMVEHGDQAPRVLWADATYGLQIFWPHLHIFDLEGNRDEKNYINLARTEFLQTEFEPMPNVGNDLLRDYFAFVLVTTRNISSIEKLDDADKLLPWWKYRYLRFQATDVSVGWQEESLEVSPWVFTSGGIAPLDGDVLTALGIKIILLVSVWSPVFMPKEPDVAVLLIENSDNRFMGVVYGQKHKRPPARLKIENAHIRGLKSDLSLTFESQMTIQSPVVEKALSRLVENAQPLKGRLEQLLLGVWSLDTSNREEKPDPVTILLNAFRRPLVTSESPSPLVSAWKDIFGTFIIPYGEDARREQLGGAYELLKHYIAAWTDLLESKHS